MIIRPVKKMMIDALLEDEVPGQEIRMLALSIATLVNSGDLQLAYIGTLANDAVQRAFKDLNAHGKRPDLRVVQ